jgi:hypothetical protein
MRPLLPALLSAPLLLSLTAAAAAQAGRYVPIPSPPPAPGGFHPHVPTHFGGGGGDSDTGLYVLAALGIVVAGGLGWAVGRALAGGPRGADSPTASFTGANSATPPGDLVHDALAVAPRAERTGRLLEFLAHQEPLFEPTALRRWAEASFLRVQECWQQGDYAPLGDLLLPAVLLR